MDLQQFTEIQRRIRFKTEGGDGFSKTLLILCIDVQTMKQYKITKREKILKNKSLQIVFCFVSLIPLCRESALFPFTTADLD